MIISRTPFRISFTGGSTDLKSFYRTEGGAVVSTTINKYMYITVNKRFDHTIRASYSKTEIVDHADALEHPIVREALKMAGITNGIEITSIADIPAGTGLGSSSSFTVGLLHALFAYQGRYASARELADRACQIEIDILHEPIGKQDQYAAAFGGLNLIQFNADESVYVDPIIMPADLHRKLAGNLLLFYTGIHRSASAVLKGTEERKVENHGSKLMLKNQSFELAEALRNGKGIPLFGRILHTGWQIKKQLSGDITTTEINALYERALHAGATGGKILGAGGGGFLCIYATKKNQGKVRMALSGLRELSFAFDYQGSKIVYVE
jgi:D-glycero-alpha-D-manno-heptose-7-phosphate kinase